ncbi:S26 family signal peptidase [Paenibacillus sp. J31TS4]|nr:S26 family signal peptidase [Paenibacillus sp. J31TS4]
MFGYEMMNVLSGSMEPSIHTGSVIFIKAVEPAVPLAVGDVITFKSDDPNIIITHRITEVQKQGETVSYMTKGDANDTQDPSPVPIANVIGKYAGVTIPFLGHILTFIKSKAGIVTFMIIPGALLILWQMISIWRYISKMENRPVNQPVAEEVQS